MTSALYVPSKKLVYVLLGGWDKTKVATDGFTALCADSKPSIIAIDPATDQVCRSAAPRRAAASPSRATALRSATSSSTTPRATDCSSSTAAATPTPAAASPAP